MKKRIYTLIIMAFVVLYTQAQGVYVARTFCENIRLYTLTNNAEYRDSIENLCSQNIQIRIANVLALILAPRYRYPLSTSYELNSYLLFLMHAKRDSIHVEFCDFENVDESLIMDTSDRKASGVEFVTYRVKISGSLCLETRDLMVIRKGKIAKISQFGKFN